MSHFLFFLVGALALFLFAGEVFGGPRSYEEKVYVSIAGVLFLMMSARIAYIEFKPSKPVSSDDAK